MSEYNTNVHSKFTLISLFSKIHSLKSEHIHSFLFREWLTTNTAVYGMVFLVTCRFSLFEALNGAFEVQVFQGFIFTPYQRHY